MVYTKLYYIQYILYIHCVIKVSVTLSFTVRSLRKQISGLIERNLGVNRADERPVLRQATAGHIEGDDSGGLWYRHDGVGEPQRAVIASDSQLDAAGVGPKEGSPCHTRQSDRKHFIILWDLTDKRKETFSHTAVSFMLLFLNSECETQKTLFASFKL